MLLAFIMLAGGVVEAMPAGPLRVCEANPRYFATPDGAPVYLTGSHTWATLHERAYPETPEFDYDEYLDFMVEHNHNLLRLWAWEHTAWMQFTDREIVYHPNRYLRVGPEVALDGLPKFDLTRLDDAFFRRLRERVVAAGERDIYVMVMLFQGFSIEQKGTKGVAKDRGNPWDGHPFHRENNINGTDGDANGNGEGEETHTLTVPEVTRLQEAFVARAIDELNDLDHIIWEISNESHGGSTQWQYHMVDLIHEYEAGKPKQHPVAMTFQWDGGTNEALFDSPAEAVSPNPMGGYKDNPPAADGSKVVLTDTDHLWGLGGDHVWVWKSFCRGLNPIFMDPYRDARMGHEYDPKYDLLRANMGYTRAYAERMDLAAATPRGDLASSGYCLANPGSQYLVYLPDGGEVTVDISAADGGLAVEWLDPRTGQAVEGGLAEGGGPRRFSVPFEGDAVLYLEATR